jgi:hypothetical protein
MIQCAAPVSQPWNQHIIAQVKRGEWRRRRRSWRDGIHLLMEVKFTPPPHHQHILGRKGRLR